MSKPDPAVDRKLRTVRDKDPYVACGRTVSYLLQIPNLARLPFGQFAKLIVGQINRGHYFFVIDEKAVIRGYCGWTHASHDEAEAWLQRNVEISNKHSIHGPVCIINIWQASTPAANAKIIESLRTLVSPNTELVLAKRFYPDGTIRPVRLPIAKSQLRQAK